MLTIEQQACLDALPEGSSAHVSKFDPRIRDEGEKFRQELAHLMPNAAIYYIGSGKLGIAGVNDIDIRVIAGDNFPHYSALLEKHLGKPVKQDAVGGVFHWNTQRGDFPAVVELAARATKRMQDHLDTQQILEARGDLRAQYERVKINYAGASLREYTQKKFEFLNEVMHPHA